MHRGCVRGRRSLRAATALELLRKAAQTSFALLPRQQGQRRICGE
jgi:hypothetical protein